MINYTAVVTVEEYKAEGFNDVESYVRSKYPNIVFDEIRKEVGRFNVTGRFPQTDYLPLNGKEWETTSFEKIRKEIAEQFS